MSIFSSLIPEAHVNHNPFDVSPRHIFSLDAGMITPFVVKHTIPSAVYDLNVLDTIELNGMPKANFGRMSQQIDFFFVPYSQLWKPFDSTYYQRLDNVRNPNNLVNPTLPDQVPTFDYWSVVLRLWDCYLTYRLLDVIKAAKGTDSQYGGIAGQVDSMSIGEAIDNYVSDYSNWSSTSAPSLFVDVHGRWCVEDMMRNFDMLGYANLLPFFQYAFKASVVMWDKNIGVSGITDNAYVDRYFSESYNNLFDAVSSWQFGVGDNETSIVDALTEMVSPDYNRIDLMVFVFPAYAAERDYYPNAWPILAYLKIYNDYYKSIQYDNENYAYYYNLDYLSNPSPGSIPDFRILQCLIPRYHLYKRDMFTGGYPNSQFGDVAAVYTDQNYHTLQGNNVRSNIVVGSNQLYSPLPASQTTTPQVRESQSFTSVEALSDKFRINGGLAVSVLAIRQAEAMQRWKEKNLRAGNRLENQQNAFFGDKSRYIADDYVREIGNTYTPIMINNVTATSDSSDPALARIGDKAASGSSSHSNNVVNRFESHDFGMIIGLIYILPESEYEAFGFDPFNIKVQPTDYFMPDFQNLGLAPVPNILFDAFAPSQEIIGYLSRYFEHKTAISKVHGEFNQDGAFRDYVSPRQKKDLRSLTLSALQVAPFDIDSLFYSESNWYQSSDKFKVNMNIVSHDVLPMSVTGLPY